IKEFLKTGFNTQDADTIGVIVLHAFGHMPGRGELINIDGLQFKVTNSDNRRILQLQITIPKTEDNNIEETAN
ncbi:MAG: transporter associated domain-containing protein, partial [Pseudoalteromonas sp.]